MMKSKTLMLSNRIIINILYASAVIPIAQHGLVLKAATILAVGSKVDSGLERRRGFTQVC